MEFQGFQNSLPTFIILLLGVLLVAIAAFSYQKLKSIPLAPRVGFIILRASAFLIILILFLNPYFFSSDIEKKNPKILVLLDDSESLTIQKGDYNGEESYQKVLAELNLGSTSGVDLEYFTIGSSSKQLVSLDSLKLRDSETNFASSISQTQELEDDFDAGIILSDGIITFGKNPIIQVSDLSIPLYTIALGDTSTVKDITLNNLVYNPTGYTDTRHIVDIEISQNGFSSQTISVKLFNSSNQVLDEKEISFETEEQVKSISFEIELKEPGLQQFTIEVEELEGEWTSENNSSTLSIDVSDSKTRILHVAFEVHPDVKMLRTILSSDENIELSTLTWLGGSRFVETTLPELDEMDLVIFHGLPQSGFNSSILEGYSQKPSFYLHLPLTRQNPSRVFPEVSLVQNTGNQLFQVNLVPNPENIDHPIMELPEIGYQNISPVIGSLRSVSNQAGSINLFKSGFQGIQTPNDILTVVELGSIRRANISTWGWYKMYQSPNESERNFVTQLFLNIATWSANNPDDRRLKIAPSRPVFNISEDVIINANLNNESGEAESQATIEVTLQSSKNEERTFNMSNEGDGAYKLDITSLTSGLYSYTANARKGDREIDSQSGEFLVEDSNSELINTIRNDGFLRALSNETGGKFFEYNKLNDFWNTLASDQILQQKEEVVESYSFPVRSVFWFILVLALLTTEWLGRKYYSLP